MRYFSSRRAALREHQNEHSERHQVVQAKLHGQGKQVAIDNAPFHCQQKNNCQQGKIASAMTRSTKLLFLRAVTSGSFPPSVYAQSF